MVSHLCLSDRKCVIVDVLFRCSALAANVVRVVYTGVFSVMYVMMMRTVPLSLTHTHEKHDLFFDADNSRQTLSKTSEYLARSS